jgi:hypothetical protein
LDGFFKKKQGAEKMAGGWRRLHNEELHNLCTSSNIVRVIKLRRVRWAGHVACVGEIRNAYRILVRKPYGKKSVRGKDNIRMDVREIGRKVWTGCIWLRIGTSDGLL